MYQGKKVVVVMPAYNASRTLERTHAEVVASGIVDLIILVDDHSQDDTLRLAAGLPLVKTLSHPRNLGYGANQKTCYRHALEEGADIVVMVHPDYQYTPRLIPAMVALVGGGLFSCVLGSRILGGRALEGGMPLWKYIGNRLLTAFGNLLLGTKVSEFHTGYRAFSSELLERLDLRSNSDDFLFDNEMLAQVAWWGFSIGEISCPARYDSDSSSIGFRRSVVYGVGCVMTGITFRLAKWGWIASKKFPAHD